MYSFSCSRRRFSLLHLLICDCGYEKFKKTKQMEKKCIFSLNIFSFFDSVLQKWMVKYYLIFRASSNFFRCSWWTCHCRCDRVHYFRLIRSSLINLLIIWRLLLHLYLKIGNIELNSKVDIVIVNRIMSKLTCTFTYLLLLYTKIVIICYIIIIIRIYIIIIICSTW